MGADFDEVLLRRMAEAGGGNFYFIENTAQISDFLAGEVGDMLGGHRSRRGARGRNGGRESWSSRSTASAAGARPAAPGASSSARSSRARPWTRSWSFTFPEGTLGSSHAVSIGLADRAQTLATGASVTFRYASHDENDAQPRERAVDRRVAALYAAKAGQEALELNRDGEYEAARRKLDACARRIAEYAGDDAEIAAILEDLKEKAARFSKVMRADARKVAYSGTIADLTLRPTAPRSTRH